MFHVKHFFCYNIIITKSYYEVIILDNKIIECYRIKFIKNEKSMYTQFFKSLNEIEAIIRSGLDDGWKYAIIENAYTLEEKI